MLISSTPSARAQFFGVLAKSLGISSPTMVDHLFVPARHDPGFVVHDKRIRGISASLDNDLDHTYLLNPVYQALRSGISAGVYLMSDILPDGYDDLIRAVEFEIKVNARETIGYLTSRPRLRAVIL